MEGSESGEARRIHMVYFLSLMGRSEGPHLIRIPHLARNGVHLQDVKRCIGEVRGKDLAEKYAWSYKRRSRQGVWQELLDDDRITPISDNEYILKGSQSSLPLLKLLCLVKGKLHAEGKQLMQKQPLIPEELQLERFRYFKPSSLDQLSLEISFDRSTLARESESCKFEPDKHVDTSKHNQDRSFSISLSSSSSSSFSPLKGSKRFSTIAFRFFRNF